MQPDVVNGIYQTIIGLISIPYIVATNLLIYSIIKFIDILNKEAVVSGVTKKVISVVTSIGMAILFHYIIAPTITYEVLLTSLLIVPFSYKFVIKYLLKTFGAYYREVPGETHEQAEETADTEIEKDSEL